jgi:protein arginine kinase
VELADVGRVGGEWLKGTGPETDVVLSSRIRLARNVAGFPFATRCDDDQRAEILGRL